MPYRRLVSLSRVRVRASPPRRLDTNVPVVVRATRRLRAYV